MTTIGELEEWLRSGEDEHLEFKEAKNQFQIDTLVDYCVAIANERGGRIVLGVTDKAPRRVVGSNALPSPGDARSALLQRLRIRVDVEEVQHPNGRVVVCHVPPRPVGVPLHSGGRYLMRSHDSVVSMTAEQLRSIFAETTADFSAEICAAATLADLDPVALETFRESWSRKSGNEHLRSLSARQLLIDAGIADGDRLRYAAVILLGSEAGMRRHLPAAEIVFEWRDGPSVHYQDRREFRGGLLTILDPIWSVINLRNTHDSVRDGLFVRDVATFNEFAIREAILNAVVHREYRAPGSVFIRQFPKRIEIESPGGFPPGVTADNVLFKQVPRNRCLAEALQRTGLVERSGQGIDRMFETSIREGKAPPDFSRSDEFQVNVVLQGVVQDPAFLRFLEKATQESSYSLDTMDLYVLDRVNRQEAVPADLRDDLAKLTHHGIVEKVGRGRGTRYLPSKQFYDFVGNKAGYTRRKGLDRETNKQLLLRHLELNQDGSSFADLCEVLPTSTQEQVRKMLKELRVEGRARTEGFTRGALWFLNLKP